MSYRVDPRGRPYAVRRTMNTSVHAELLIGKGWEAIAHAELKRLALVVGTYHQQLKDNAGYDETGRAVVALEEAVAALEHALDEDDEDKRVY